MFIHYLFRTFDGAIGLVLESRRTQGVVVTPNLTLHDLFYREVCQYNLVELMKCSYWQVSCIDEIFRALLDNQEHKLHSLTDQNSRIRLVATVLSAFKVC